MHDSEVPVLRINVRMESQLPDNTMDSTVLLVAAASDRLGLRCSRSVVPGETVRLAGMPDFHSRYEFEAEILSCQRRQDPQAGLDYFETEGRLSSNWPEYRRFLDALRTSCRSMGEDLRVYSAVPFELRLNNRRFRTESGNVSLGGAFIQTFSEKIPDPGTTFAFWAAIPPGKEPISGTGEVIYGVDESQARRLGTSSGFGARLEFEEDERLVWADFIHSLYQRILS